MTLTEHRTVVLPPKEKAPEVRPPRTPVRWLGWTFGLLVVAAGAVLVVLAMVQGGESFEELYEAESGLALGAIHEAGFESTTYFVGQSDMTLEEFEMMILDPWVKEYMFLGEPFESVYEAGSGLTLGAIHEPGFVPTTYFVGLSGGTLEEFEAGLR